MSPPTLSRRGWIEATGAGWLTALASCSPPAAAPSSEPSPPSKTPSPPSPAAGPPSGELDLIDPALALYVESHSAAESAAMRAIAEDTQALTEWGIMMVGPLEAGLLRLLVRLRGARRVVEVGTFTGYSAIAMAEGLPEGGRLITCDVDETWTAIARRHWATSPHGHKIELKLGPASETLPTLEGPFELAFIDADKESYPLYWDLLVPKMAAGGLVVVDNVLAGGRVVSPDEPWIERVAAFNAKVAADPRVEPLLLPIRDGVMIARVI